MLSLEDMAVLTAALCPAEWMDKAAVDWLDWLCYLPDKWEFLI